MISLDTNAVLRFLLGDIPDQMHKATELVEKNTVYVTDVVVVEIIYVLEKVYKLSRNDIHELVGDFLGFSNVVHNPSFLLDAIKSYKEHPSLSIVDCYASEEARHYGNELITLDKRLVDKGGAHIRNLLQ